MTSTVLACTVEVRHTYHGDDEFSGPDFVPFRQIAFTCGPPGRCALLCARPQSQAVAARRSCPTCSSWREREILTQSRCLGK